MAIVWSCPLASPRRVAAGRVLLNCSILQNEPGRCFVPFLGGAFAACCSREAGGYVDVVGEVPGSEKTPRWRRAVLMRVLCLEIFFR